MWCTPDYEWTVCLHKDVPRSQDVLLLTTVNNESLAKHPHGKRTLDIGFQFHLQEIEINRLHYRNIESCKECTKGNLGDL